MSKHKGSTRAWGPPTSAPFVPVHGATMEDCVEIARALGKRVGDELGIPVYLYEAAASRRSGGPSPMCGRGVRGFPEKLKEPFWRPTLGRPPSARAAAPRSSGRGSS